MTNQSTTDNALLKEAEAFSQKHYSRDSWVQSAAYHGYLAAARKYNQREIAEKAWVDTKERMPEIGEKVFCLWHDVITYQVLVDENGFWYSGVSHWMKGSAPPVNNIEK